MKRLCSSVLIAWALALSGAEPTRLEQLVTIPQIEVSYDTIELYGKPVVIGEVIELFEGDHLTYRAQDSSVHITVPWKQVKRIEQRRSVAAVVAERGQQLLQAQAVPALAAQAETELLRLVRWGVEREQAAACAPLVIAALQANPQQVLLRETAVDVLLQIHDDRALEPLLREGIAARPNWRRGYEELAKLLSRQGRQGELDQFVQVWIAALPTNETANALLAEAAEGRGDVRQAQECHRKLYTLYQRPRSGLAFVRLSLALGEVREALAVADALLASDPQLPGLSVIAGSAFLAAGNTVRARTLLRDANADALSDVALQPLRDYNRAVLAWREGNDAQALRLLQSVDHPAARFAEARITRIPVSDAAVLQVLGPLARQLNAALALEQEQPERAQAFLGNELTDRSLELRRIAAAQLADYDAASLRALAETPGREATLWYAYGLMRSGDCAGALRVLSGLPDKDGWAATYRMYCSEALGDSEGAGRWYRQAVAASQAPRAYLDQATALYFRSKDDREMVEPFDWPEGEMLQVGWFRQARGTNITISASGGALRFSGTQTAGAQPVSRAWRVLPKADLRRITVQWKPGAQGAQGLEVRDQDGRSGLAVAVLAGQRLAWRRLREGNWDEWRELLARAPEQCTLWLDPEQPAERQVQLLTERQNLPLTSLLDLPSDQVQLGFFVEAQPGQQVDFAIEELRIQLAAVGAP